MDNIISSKKAADFLNVNESTVKRWADIGYLKCIKTPGGHRKFKIEDLQALAKKYDYETSYMRIDDDKSDLMSNIQNGNFKPIVKNLQKNILNGNVNLTYKLLYTLYINNCSLEDIFDLIVKESMKNIGIMWMNKMIGIENEHIASNTIQTALFQLEKIVQKKESINKTAICAGLEKEFHEIGLLCVKISLEYDGWNVIYPGTNLPYKSLIKLIEILKPDLVCLSTTYISNITLFEKQILSLHKKINEFGGILLIGGHNTNRKSIMDLKCNSTAEMKKILRKNISKKYYEKILIE
ncbi:MAG: cobalamin-dependent protein [Ignavibacteria bacterium]